MASGRMLQRKISQSHDVAELMTRVGAELGSEHGPMAALLFTWCIAHLDREGRMHGDPRLVRSQVFPLVEQITAVHIGVYLKHMHQLGLMAWYEVNGRWWLAFPAFEANQPGFRKEKEQPSQIPAPDQGVPFNGGVKTELLRLTDGAGTPEEKGIGKEVEGKRTIPGPPSASAGEFDFEAVYAKYPRKEGRKKGLARFKSQITSRLKYDALIRAVENYAATVTDTTYAKHFDTFMGCWEDYVDAGLLTPKRTQKTGNTAPGTFTRGGDLTDEYT